jgi:ankyrin repeat protein
MRQEVLHRLRQAVLDAHTALFEHRFEDFKTMLETCKDLNGQNMDFVVRESGGFELSDFETVPGQKFRNLLACAVDKGDLDVATFLLDHGANPNPYDWDETEWGPMLEYFLSPVPNGIDMFKLLVQRGADPHARVEHGGDPNETVWTQIQRYANTRPHVASLRDALSTIVTTTESEALVLRKYDSCKS